MTGRIERLVLKWLRAAAPRGWSETVIGDLREDLDARGRRSRARTLVLTAAVAARFTLEAAVARLRSRPPRTHRRGRRNMDILTDLRQAARALWRTPGFSLVAILTLALAIGANTAIYSALSSIVLNPLAFKDGHRYVLLWHFNKSMGGLMVTPPVKVAERWRSATHVFEAVESYWTTQRVIVGSGDPEELSLTYLMPSALPTFGVQPTLGRSFTAADHEGSAQPVVLLSHALWQSRFGGDRDVLGKTVTLSGTPYVIVGVMPRRFALPMGSDAIWTAVRQGVDAFPDHGVPTIARLAPGITIEQAQTALAAMPASEEPTADEGWTGRAMPPADINGTRVKSALFVLTGAVGLLLLIACVNVANLILTRYGARRREVAMRHALGASRARLARYLLAESFLLAVSGGAAGLAVAYAGLSAMSALRPRQLDVLERLALDPQALAFALATTLVTVILFGLAPAITASRADLQEVLKAAGRTATASSHRVRSALTVAQVALALVLLVGAGLLFRSYAQLVSVDPGFDPEGVLSVRVSLPESRYPRKDPAGAGAFFQQALASIEALPGVRSAAMGMGIPTDSGIMFGTIEVEGETTPRDAGLFVGGAVTHDYFTTLGIDIIQGRAFSPDDARGDRNQVAIVGKTFATQAWPGQSAIGKRLRVDRDQPWLTVVGVAADVKALDLSADAGAQPQIYTPRDAAGYGAIIVRAEGDPMALVPAVKATIWAIDGELPLDRISTAEQLLRRSTSQARFNLALLGVFAACGLTLAGVGVYGVTALFVGQRQREVGIRMALGASRGAVAGLILRQTATLLLAAVATGAGAAWWLSRYLDTLVFATDTTDALTFGAAGIVVAAAAIAATLVPLRRATSVDPAIVLRAE